MQGHFNLRLILHFLHVKAQLQRTRRAKWFRRLASIEFLEVTSALFTYSMFVALTLIYVGRVLQKTLLKLAA